MHLVLFPGRLLLMTAEDRVWGWSNLSAEMVPLLYVCLFLSSDYQRHAFREGYFSSISTEELPLVHTSDIAPQPTPVAAALGQVCSVYVCSQHTLLASSGYKKWKGLLQEQFTGVTSLQVPRKHL